MNEVGEKLKEARKAKGYTLDDLQQITKIQKRYLIAVEEGNLDVLPGNFYARAFIKQYADTVGLNGNELINEHTEHIPTAKDDDYSKKVSQTQKRDNAKTSNFWIKLQDALPTILLLVLVLAVAVAIYIAFMERQSEGRPPMIGDDGDPGLIVNPDDDEPDNGDSDEDTPDDDDSDNGDSNDGNSDDDPNDGDSDDEDPGDSDNDDSDDGDPNDDGDEEEQSYEVSSISGDTTTYTVTGTHPESQTISLIASGGESWVSIQVDGETVGQALLSSGQSLDAEFDSNVSQVSVVIGSSSVTSVELNGETVPYPDEQSSVVRQDIIFNFE